MHNYGETSCLNNRKWFTLMVYGRLSFNDWDYSTELVTDILKNTFLLIWTSLIVISEPTSKETWACALIG